MSIGTMEVVLRLDPHDGNDPIEATARLPMGLIRGDLIEVWIQEEQTSACRQEWLEVEHVVLCTWAPERIEVWVKMDSYDREEVERVFKAIEGNEQP